VTRARVGLNVHVHPTSFEFSTRVLKVTKALSEGGVVDRTIVIATQKPGLPERETFAPSREVWRIGPPFRGGGSRAKALWFLTWSAQVFRQLRRESIGMVNCHTLSALPICVALAAWHRAILVYEPHELETETITSRGVRRRLSKVLEGVLVRRAARVIVVSDSIARAYEHDYGLRDVTAILNAPELDTPAHDGPNPVFRDEFGIPSDHLIFMYQGDLSAERGIPLLLEAFANVPESRHLLLMGFGPLADDVKAAAAARANIHFRPAVHPSEVLQFTRGADVGFALLTDDCINHRFALPNKFFHYLHAGIPVVASDLPEMRAIVERYACGWNLPGTAAAVAELVARIDRGAIEARRPGVLRARAELNWGRESARLLAVYDSLLAPAGG